MTENTRQEAVEAAVVGDEIKVEAALQEMLSKLEGLEEVASEDSRSVELKGSLEEKIKKEEELRKEGLLYIRLRGFKPWH